MLTTKLFSTKTNYINAKLSYSFNGKVASLNSQIFEVLNCKPNETLYGFYLSNGHWRRPVDNKDNYSITMNYWVDIYCLDSYGTIWPIEKDLTVKFNFSKIQNEISQMKKIEVEID